jgi:hypothetical protein
MGYYPTTSAIELNYIPTAARMRREFLSDSPVQPNNDPTLTLPN